MAFSYFGFSYLYRKKLHSFFFHLSLEKIGLISKNEIPTSAVSVEQAEMFLANPSQSGDKSSLTVIESFDANEDDDYDNLVSSCFIIFIS